MKKVWTGMAWKTPEDGSWMRRRGVAIDGKAEVVVSSDKGAVDSNVPEL